MNIYVDAMGGDFAPKEIVKGAIEAVNEFGIDLTLVGQVKKIEEQLKDKNFEESKITILPATEVIDFNEEPVKAIRKKKDSSIVVALNYMKKQPDSVLVSAGSTGALLAGATLILGRIKGVKRPGLAVNIPQLKKNVFLIDVGASSDAQPSYLLNYALLANVYLENVLKTKNPSIGLVNIGTEEEKGSQLVKEANQLLKKSLLNYQGYVEPKEIMTTEKDILITDGFTGNILIKTIEGISDFVFTQIKNKLTASSKGKIGALLIKNDLKELKNQFSSEDIGGAPFLGVKGGVIKAHGSSKAKAIKNSIYQAILFVENNVEEKLKKALESSTTN